MEALNKNIKKLRLLKGMNQSEFAEMFGLSRANIGSYEEGRAQPKINVISKIAEHFELSLDQFVNQELTINELSSFSLLKENPPIYNSPDTHTIRVPFIQSVTFRKYISLGRTKETLTVPRQFSSDLALEIDATLAKQVDSYRSGDVLFLKKMDAFASNDFGPFLIWTENKLHLGYTRKQKDALLLTPSVDGEKHSLTLSSPIDRLWRVTAVLSAEAHISEEHSLLARIDLLEQKLTQLILSKK